MTTWQDIIQALQGEQMSRRSHERVLQGLIWLYHALYLSGLAPGPFANKYLGHSAKSNLIYKWLSGETFPSKTSVKRVGMQLPDSLDIYFHPLFPLLAAQPLSLARVRKLLSVYKNSCDELFPWSFPNDDELRAQGRFVPTMARDDSASLVARGDIYGFAVIVGLVREAEAKGDSEMYWIHSANMFRALPAVARIPWFREHYKLLRACVNTIYTRSRTTTMIFGVNWDIIDQQIQAPVHETIRERRPRDPETRRFTELEDPIEFRWR